MKALALLLLTSPVCAGTADSFVPRDPACAHVATVQYLDCEVSLIYTCPGLYGLPAPIYREEVFAQTGLSHYSLATGNGAPLLSADPQGQVVITADAATLEETPWDALLASGNARFSSTGTLAMMGVAKPVRMTVDIVMSDKSVSIGSQTGHLLEADVALDLPAPMGRIVSHEQGYMMPALHLMITGETLSGTFFKPARTPHRPLDISLPGEPGFETTAPSTCGSLSRLFPSPHLNGVPA